MKLLASVLVAVAFLVSTPVSAVGTDPLTIEKVFVPEGFDSNDTVEVWFFGYMSTPCDEIEDVRVNIDEATGEIVLEPLISAADRTTALCPTVIKPLLQNVQLGQLAAGEYHMRIVGEEERYELVIEEATRGDVDDHFYAPVEEINAQVGRDVVRIYGRYPLMLRGCALIDEVQVDRNAADLVVLKPILAIGFDRECVGHKLEFTVDVPLDQPLPENSLIYVRTINGTSNNQFVGELPAR